MLRWLSPRRWQGYAARARCREQLALLLWPYLPATLRHADDNLPMRQINTVVRRLESGNDDFFDDAGALTLWQAARNDNDIQQAVGALRTLNLQLQGDGVAAGLVVEPPAHAILKGLRKQMIKDATYNEIDDWQQLPALLPLLSALILCSGWFFNQIYLGQLGLDVGDYFGLSDYLAASMEGLVPALGGVIFTLLAQWLVRGRQRLQNMQRLLGLRWRSQVVSILTYALIFLIVERLTSDLRAQRVLSVYVGVIALSTLLVPWAVSFFKRPARTFLFLNFFSIYSVVLWFSAEMRYVDVLRDRPVRTEIVLASAPDKPLNWRVLSGNSLYLFLHNEQKEVIAVPVQQVLSVRFRSENENTTVVTPVGAVNSSTK